MGAPHDAHHLGAERDVPGPHVPDERAHNGHQGHPVVPVGAVDRRAVGRVGPQVLPAGDRLLHVRAHPPDDYQYVVVLRHDQHQRRVRGHLLHRVRVRGGRDDGGGALARLRARVGDVRRQHGDLAGAGRVPDGPVRRGAGGGGGHGRGRAGRVLHHGGGAREPAREGAPERLGPGHQLGAGRPVRGAAQGGRRAHRAHAVRGRVPVVPARGGPVLVHLRVPEAGDGLRRGASGDIHRDRGRAQHRRAGDPGLPDADARAQAHHHAGAAVRDAAADVVRLRQPHVDDVGGRRAGGAGLAHVPRHQRLRVRQQPRRPPGRRAGHGHGRARAVQRAGAGHVRRHLLPVPRGPQRGARDGRGRGARARAARRARAALRAGRAAGDLRAAGGRLPARGQRGRGGAPLAARLALRSGARAARGGRAVAADGARVGGALAAGQRRARLQRVTPPRMTQVPERAGGRSGLGSPVSNFPLLIAVFKLYTYICVTFDSPPRVCTYFIY